MVSSSSMASNPFSGIYTSPTAYLVTAASIRWSVFENRSEQQLREGKVVVKTWEELEAMANG